MTLTLPEPILTSDLFPDVLAGLLDLLKNLSEEDWQRPTACTGWTVKDVAMHLLGADVGNLSRRRDGNRVSLKTNSWDELVKALNDFNETWVEAGRRISSRILIEMLELVGPQMCAYFATLDPFAMGGPVSWVGPKPAKVWLDIAREYTERWQHQQHIRDAVGMIGLRETRFLQPVIHTYMLALPRAFHHAVEADGSSVSVTVNGPAGGKWSLLSMGGFWRLYSGSADTPDAHVYLDEDLAWRLASRGVPREEANARIDVVGNRKLGENILELVAFIG